MNFNVSNDEAHGLLDSLEFSGKLASSSLKMEVALVTLGSPISLNRNRIPVLASKTTSNTITLRLSDLALQSVDREIRTDSNGRPAEHYKLEWLGSVDDYLQESSVDLDKALLQDLTINHGVLTLIRMIYAMRILKHLPARAMAYAVQTSEYCIEFDQQAKHSYLNLISGTS